MCWVGQLVCVVRGDRQPTATVLFDRKYDYNTNTHNGQAQQMALLIYLIEWRHDSISRNFRDRATVHAVAIEWDRNVESGKIDKTTADAGTFCPVIMYEKNREFSSLTL